MTVIVIHGLQVTLYKITVFFSFFVYRLYSEPAPKVCSNMCCSPNLNYAHGLN